MRRLFPENAENVKTTQRTQQLEQAQRADGLDSLTSQPIPRDQSRMKGQSPEEVQRRE